MKEGFSFIKEQLDRKILLTNIESFARTDKTSKRTCYCQISSGNSLIVFLANIINVTTPGNLQRGSIPFSAKPVWAKGIQ
jgi:hypothetical protein